MLVVRLLNDPEAPGVFLAAVKVKNGHATPKIPIYSMVTDSKIVGPPNNAFMSKGVMCNSSGSLKHIKRFVKMITMFLFGIEYVLIGEILIIASRGCNIRRISSNIFIKCKNSIFRFSKVDQFYYALSYAKGSETGIRLARYPALKIHGLFITYASRLLSKIIGPLKQRLSS